MPMIGRIDAVLAGSTVATIVARTVDRLRSHGDQAVVVRWVRLFGAGVSRGWQGSGTDRTRRAGYRWVAGSTAVHRGASLVARIRWSLGRAVATARFGSVVVRAEGATRASLLYRWLTAEPEPDVIVIDLRETRTVGPFLSAVDRGIAAVTPGMASARFTDVAHGFGVAMARRPIRYTSIGILGVVTLSLLGTILVGRPDGTAIVVHLVVAAGGLLGLRSTHSLADLQETVLWRWLAEAFEPPEPPSGDQ